MSEPYIKRVRVQDFGCVKDATLEFTRLHALIGPNDSGKTTLLRAVRTALQFASGTFYGNHAPSKLEPFDPGVREGEAFKIDLTAAGVEPAWDSDYSVGSLVPGSSIEEALARGEQMLAKAARRSWNTPGALHGLSVGKAGSEAFQVFLRPSQWLHLDADAMRQETQALQGG